MKSPADAAVVGTPVLFPDGGNPGANGSSTTSGCHDITAYPSKDIAAGACMGDGILMDISDPVNPWSLDRGPATRNFAFWHSATFNNAGTKVVFTDELGGGGAPTCNPTVGPNRARTAIYDIVGPGATAGFKSYFKIPRTQTNTENCVAHNGSLIPVKGRDIMVQAWYQGGISVWDFTDSASPGDRLVRPRPARPTPPGRRRLVVGVLLQRLHLLQRHPEGLRRVRPRDPRTTGREVRMDAFNPQSQPSYNG